jgi:hypothetical protein
MNNNVVDIATRERIDLAGALVDGINHEAARRAVRRHVEVAIVAAFDLNDPVHAVSQLRDAIAVINTLALEPEPGA